MNDVQDIFDEYVRRGLMPIRCELSDDGDEYILTARTGEVRSLGWTKAKLALLGAAGLRSGRNAMLWGLAERRANPLIGKWDMVE